MPRLPVMAAYSLCAWAQLALGGRDLLLELLDLLHQLHDGGDVDDGELRVGGADARRRRERSDQEH